MNTTPKRKKRNFSESTGWPSGVWTIKRAVTVHFLPIINSGGRPLYGGLDLEVFPISHNTVELPDYGSPFWVSIVAGFEDFFDKRSKEGRPIGFVRIDVKQVYSHPCDTTEKHMRRVARWALEEVFKKHELELPSE